MNQQLEKEKNDLQNIIKEKVLKFEQEINQKNNIIA